MATKAFPRILSALLILVLLLPAASLPAAAPAAVRAQGAGPTAAQEVPPPAPTEADAGQAVDGDWWAQAQTAIQAAEYEITWQENLLLAETTAAYQGPNRGQDFRTYFLPDSVLLVPRGWTGDTAPVWQLRLSLADAGPAELAPEGNRIEYRRNGAATEWYRNESAGVMQGFEVLAEQGSVGAGEQAIVTLTVETDLVPTVAPDGQAIDFADAAGGAVLRYASLRATDAAGRDFPGRLALAPAGNSQASTSTLQILTGRADVAFPLTVAAVLTSLAAPAAPSGLAPTPAWTAEGDQENAGFGFSVATAGDVNADGYSDVIVGAPSYDYGQVNEGRAFVYYGSAWGLSQYPGWTAESDQEYVGFGDPVATAGDVNGDGYADVIVGAYLYTNGQYQEGRAYLYYGSAAGLGINFGWIAESDQQDAAFAFSVATAGDVNGDGYADVIVGAPLYDNDQEDEGRAFLYYGSAGGLRGSAGWTAEGDLAEAHFGQSVATAGDVNGDGYSDIIVGMPDCDFGQFHEGRAYVYYGAAGGLSSIVGWTAEGDQVWATFGSSVATAGDVNGDGYADVIVGAPGYHISQANEGWVFVYRGGALGLSTVWDWLAGGNQAHARFGSSVATAGDVNGDGYADIVVGAPDYDNGQYNEGRVIVYHGGRYGLQLFPYPNWTAESNQAGAYFGRSVATAGDVNGDGYSDIIVGAYGYDNGVDMEGMAFVYHGSGDGLYAGWNLYEHGRQADAHLGWSVATAGDVNGDGYADVIVGAPHYDNGQVDEGRAYVFYGKAVGSNYLPAWFGESDQANAQYGYSVATAGDVNGDGYADVIVGAPGYDNGQVDEGRAFVYHGDPGGLSTNPGWIAESDVVIAYFGRSAGTAGDTNGDGYADVIVGAPGYSNGQFSEGGAFVYRGSASGLAAAPGWTAESNQERADFATSVGTAGDVNGDGYADVIVGAPLYDNGETDEGRAYAYYGSAGGLSAGPGWTAESNQEGARFGYSVATAGSNCISFAEVIVGAPWYDNGQTNEGRIYLYRGGPSGLQSMLYFLESNQEGADLGTSVATAGDVDGDGSADIIAGAPGYDRYNHEEGRVYVYYTGPDCGPNDDRVWMAEGGQADAHLGTSVGAAGDLNGDGYADVIAGAPYYDYETGRTDEGGAFVYYGNSSWTGDYLRVGTALVPQQRRADDTAPIAPGGKSDRTDAFRLALLGRTPFGRGRVKLEWEIKRTGALFNGQGIGSSASWVDTGTTGAVLNQLVTGLAPCTYYHWRVRVRYHPASNPFQQRSRWVTVPWNGWNEADLRTAGSRTWLPLVQR